MYRLLTVRARFCPKERGIKHLIAKVRFALQIKKERKKCGMAEKSSNAVWIAHCSLSLSIAHVEINPWRKER